MSKFHGTVLSIKHANELIKKGINREAFLDKALKHQTDIAIASGKEILFLGNDIAQSTSKTEYKLFMHGVLPCGSKTTLIVSGIEPYADVRFNPDETEQQIRKRIAAIASTIEGLDDNPYRLEFKSGNDFMYFDHIKHNYARVLFKTLSLRNLFIKECIANNVKTYSNDSSSYFRVVSRDYDLNLSGWSIIRNFKREFGSKYKSAFVLKINIKDIESIVDDDKLAEVATSHGIDPSVVRYENMILSSFDIEMIPAKPDAFPDAEKNSKDEIFMICMTYHFVKRNESILNVCLTLKETDPMDEMLIVHCASECCLIAAFAKFMSLMQPDFITEFNGSGFDWRNIIAKSRIFGIQPAFLKDMSLVELQSWQTRSVQMFHPSKDRPTRIKINGSTADALCRGLKMEGFVSFDTMVVSKQLEPDADSHKLNECLRRSNLGSKDALDIQEMFRIYREGSSKEMCTVAHYCYIDTVVLQRLLLKKNVVQDRREVGIMSYTSINDSFTIAGSARMCNLVMNRGAKLGYFFDTKHKPDVEDPEAKFPGAFVVPPNKGVVAPMLRLDEFMKLNNIEYSDTEISAGYEFIEKNFKKMYHSDDKIDPKTAPPAIRKYVEYANDNQNQYPVSGLDFASLYPSIIMTYNISPEKLIVDEDYAKRMESMGYTLLYLTFPFCGQMLRARFVRHNNDEEQYSVCGKLLIELFNRRAAIKKVLKHYGEKIFEMEQEMKPFLERDELNQYPRLAEYNETKFDYANNDSKQKAVKIFMNTLYGVMGSFFSHICAIEVAGGVTCMGRHNLQLIKSFVETDHKMKVYYGDTDSLYVACNPSHFIDYDREYFTGNTDKLSYATKLVEETFVQIEITKNSVNEYLTKNNGSKFLKMAYEEVLYPVAFLSKKKYFGIPHEENVDFFPRNLFIRGLEIVKRGASGVLKDVVLEVIQTIVDISNTQEVLDIIKQAIARVFNTNWEIDAFAKSKVYRPDKKNPSVQRMMERYRAINYPSIPEPNVRFKTVMCKHYPWSYDVEGKQSCNSVGDRMELVQRVIDEGLEIDLEYYFDGELTGQFARLITFLDEFKDVSVDITEVDPNTMDQCTIDAINKENYKRYENALFNAAKKFIGQLAKQYSNAPVNKGPFFKKTWGEVSFAVGKRTDILCKHRSIAERKVIAIFQSSKENVEDTIVDWTLKFIAGNYKIILDDDAQQKLRFNLKNVTKFVDERKLFPILINQVDIWKQNIVNQIRCDYDYEYVCTKNLPYDALTDVMTAKELEIMLMDKELFPSIGADNAMEIIDKICWAITHTLTTDQMMQ